MSTTIICRGCAGLVEIEADYRRNKIRCPSCGVICDIPATPQENKRTPARPDKTSSPLSKPSQSVQRDPNVRRPPASFDSPPDSWTCDQCGESFPLLGRQKPNKKPCPQCGARPRRPPRPAQHAVPLPEPVLRHAPKTPPVSVDDDDNSDPYTVIPGTERYCPCCSREIDRGALICPRCDLDFATGKSVVRIYAPLAQRWGWGMPVQFRLGLLAAGEAVILPLGIVKALLDDNWAEFFWASALFTMMLTFLVGTYPVMDLTRDRKGRVRLTRTWRVAFIVYEPKEISLGEFEGVATGPVSATDFWEWILLAVFLPMGVVPGLLWWYHAIYRQLFFVALTREHGYPAETIYRGWSQEKMQELAELVREVANLPSGN